MKASWLLPSFYYVQALITFFPLPTIYKGKKTFQAFERFCAKSYLILWETHLKLEITKPVSRHLQKKNSLDMPLPLAPLMHLCKYKIRERRIFFSYEFQRLKKGKFLSSTIELANMFYWVFSALDLTEFYSTCYERLTSFVILKIIFG